MNSKMSKLTKSYLLIVSFALIAVAFSACSSQFVPPGKETSTQESPVSLGPVPSNGLAQSNAEGGAVTIEMRWLGTRNGSLVFDVAMDTHSVDLDQYDLGRLAILRDDAAREYRPVSWDSAPGGHHRSGKLTFPIPDSLNQRQTQYLEIVISDVGGIEERVLKWQL